MCRNHDPVKTEYPAIGVKMLSVITEQQLLIFKLRKKVCAMYPGQG
jgi:hypothetical protein